MKDKKKQDAKMVYPAYIYLVLSVMSFIISICSLALSLMTVLIKLGQI